MTNEMVPLDKIGSLPFPEDHVVCNYPERNYGELLLVSAQIKEKIKMGLFNNLEGILILIM